PLPPPHLPPFPTRRSSDLEVTGGENGLTFSQPRLSLLGLDGDRFTPVTLHWFVLAVVTLAYLLIRRILQSPFGKVLESIRENEADRKSTRLNSSHEWISYA